MAQHQARKRFGQNFLHDESVIGDIVRAIDPQPNDTMIEIGPGLAALTQPLLQRLGHLTVIELDRDLVSRLEKRFTSAQLTIVSADALTVDFSQFGSKLRIVGNLPYNISSPLLFHLLPFADLIQDQHFMLQREVVERMVAKPGQAAYSRLSVVLQYRYRLFKLMDVAPEAFDPAPKVVSAIVRMRPLNAERPRAQDEQLFHAVVATSFAQRRKMLRGSLSKVAAQIDWEQLGLAATARPAELSVADFIRLSDALSAQGVCAAAL